MPGGQDPFRALAETTPDAIITATADDRIAYVNPAAERLLGYRADELQGELVTTIIPEGQRGIHHDAFERFVETGEATLVGHTVAVRALRRDGTEVPVELSLGAAGSGPDTVLTAVLRDVSDRERFQRNVDAQLAVTAVLAGTAAARDAPIVGTLAEALGWDVGALWLADHGDALRLAELWQADPEATATFARACREGRFRRGEGVPGRVWRDGEAEWLEEAGQAERFVRTEAAKADGLRTGVALPLVTEGAVIGVLEVFTCRHEPVDEALRDMLATVASQIGENLRRDQHATELARSNADLEHFAQIVAHDLTEPLNTIAGFADLLGRGDRAPDEQEEFVAAIASSARRGQDLLERILTLARFGAGDLEREPVDCEAVLADALTALRGPIEESGAAVVAGPLPTLMADRTLLSQVFQNLLANAVKFRRPGVAPMIRLSAERDDEAIWRFAVADNGQGTTAGDEIFQMFQRPVGQTQDGLGIGLSLCAKIVERHGGTIWFDSEPGAGTTFSFTLPADPESWSDAVEVARRCSEAFVEGGPLAVAPFLAEDLRWFPGLVRDSVSVRGREAYLAHHRAAASEGVSLDVEDQTLRDLGGGRVLNTGVLVITTPEGVERRPLVWLLTVQEGLIASIAAHGSEAEALASVGL